MKKTGTLIALILTALVLISFTACSKSQPPELELIKDRLVYLIEGSKELNVLFFGKGLPVHRRDGLLAERLGIYNPGGITGYENVSEFAAYHTLDELKEIGKPIYSADYLSEIAETAFDGVLIGTTGAYLRFYQAEDVLYQNENATDFGFSERIYDYSTMEIDPSSMETFITVNIESYSLSNPERQTVKLTFVFENGDWYLNSPTY